MKRRDLSLDKNCDREVQLRICAGRLFNAIRLAYAIKTHSLVNQAIAASSAE